MNTVLPRNFQPHVIVFSMTSYLLIFILFHLYLPVVNSINASKTNNFLKTPSLLLMRASQLGSVWVFAKTWVLGGSIHKSYYHKLLLIFLLLTSSSSFFFLLYFPPHCGSLDFSFFPTPCRVFFFFTWISFLPNP